MRRRLPCEIGPRPPLLKRKRNHPRRILVCTDCLSEGVNLQAHFDAVIHYDLSWNPTRHEQREGRVDRFGQPKPEIRTITYIGKDNQIDGIVLDVLLRKHKQIKSDLGISVAVPGSSEDVVEAILEGMLLQGQSQDEAQPMLPQFDEWLRPQRDEIYVLVGTEAKLIGVLCVADVFGRLNDFAEAFVLIYEIEHEVRDLIKATTGQAGLPPLIANMKLPENTRPLRTVTDFTFDQYRGLICAKANWPTFETAFNCIREVIDEDFKQITDLRNTVFHFRRGITPRDTDRLRRFRDSLRYGMELFRQSKLAQTHIEPAPAS